MAPNLNCRMVQSHLPEVESYVMAQVFKIDQNGVTATLLEYNSIKGRMDFDTDPDCIVQSVVGRIEPLKVAYVDEARNYIALSRCSTDFHGRMACEQTYNMRKYVHSVLLSIADDNNIDLEKIYHITHWPSYVDLPLLQKARWLKKEMKKEMGKEGLKLRNAILERIELMDYFSWRIQAPWILNLCHLIQKLATCWAFALVRHLEAYLKLKKELPVSDYLSYQDLINKVPKHLFLFHGDKEEGQVRGSIGFLNDLVPVLTQRGVIPKEQCPLTHSLDEYLLETALGPSYTVEKVVIRSSHRRSRASFEREMIEEMHLCPIAASVVWFKSYERTKADVILTPTPEEELKFKRTRCDDETFHTMLLTGRGVDCKGKRFLELQDCNGDVNNFDRGFVRMSQEPNPVVEYAQFAPSPDL